MLNQAAKMYIENNFSTSSCRNVPFNRIIALEQNHAFQPSFGVPDSYGTKLTYLLQNWFASFLFVT